ncbi:MAG TPA: DUF420 domain-containing protein [Myxococcota bacterium]|nr:DUF420 domain-containing protein [Myxococcota bacterium]
MQLDPKVAYWTGAFVNMVAALAIAAFGASRIRRAEIPSHARSMKIAVTLVVLFVVSYAVKLRVLGREALELWEPRFVHVLRFHETCIAVMVLAGGTALYLATTRRLADTPAPERMAERARIARIHRACGWTALVACGLGALSAGYVLYGMYARLS